MRFTALLLALIPAALCQLDPENRLKPETQARPSVRGFSTISGVCDQATAINRFSGPEGTLKSCKETCENDPQCAGLNLITDEAQCVLLAQACQSTSIPDASAPTQNFYLKGEISCSTSTVGQNFVVAFMSNRVAKPVNMSLELWVTQDSVDESTVELTSHPSQGLSRTIAIPNKQAVKSTVPHTWKMTDVDAGVQIERKALHLKSDVDFVFYGVNKEYFTADAFLGIPSRSLGTRYLANCMWPPFYNCEFAFTPVEDGTTVRITLPRVATRNTGNWAKPPTEESVCNLPFQGNTYTNGDTFTITLDMYEVAQIQDPCDLTGAIIQSDKPIAFWSGDSRVNIGDAPSRDHQVEELFSTDTWGYDCAAWPTPNRQEGLVDYWVITAAEDNTVIRVVSNEMGERSYSLNAAESVRFPANSVREWQRFSSDKKFLAVQYAHSAVDNSVPGDPAMTTCIPSDQFGFGYTFVTPTGVASPYTNFLTIITKQGNEDGFVLDGQPVTSIRWNPIPGSDLVGGYVQLDESRQQFRIEHRVAGTTFEGYIYGSGDRESIAYPTGACIKALGECFPSTMFVADGKDNDCDGVIDEELCDGVDNDFDGQVDEDCYDRKKAEEDRCPEVYTATGCHGGAISLNCDSGNIKVITAHYGRLGKENEMTCGAANPADSCHGYQAGCGWESIQTTVDVQCNGKQMCMLPVGQFHSYSKCPGCSLYAQVQYVCLNAKETEHGFLTGDNYKASSWLPTTEVTMTCSGKDSDVGTQHHPKNADHSTTNHVEAWRPSKCDAGTSWLQVDLGSQYAVGWYAISGCRAQDYYVTKFGISYSTDGDEYTMVTDAMGEMVQFDGNADSVTAKVCTLFKYGIVARYMRIHPVESQNGVCAHVDFGHASEFKACPIEEVANTNLKYGACAGYGQTLKVMCQKGWATGNGETSYKVKCSNEGQWEGRFRECSNLLYCPDMPKFENGFATGVSTQPGSRIRFRCKEGFSLQGERAATCGQDGQWDAQPPVCEAPQQ